MKKHLKHLWIIKIESKLVLLIWKLDLRKEPRLIHLRLDCWISYKFWTLLLINLSLLSNSKKEIGKIKIVLSEYLMIWMIWWKLNSKSQNLIFWENNTFIKKFFLIKNLMSKKFYLGQSPLQIWLDNKKECLKQEVLQKKKTKAKLTQWRWSFSKQQTI